MISSNPIPHPYYPNMTCSSQSKNIFQHSRPHYQRVCVCVCVCVRARARLRLAAVSPEMRASSACVKAAQAPARALTDLLDNCQ